MGKFRRGGCKTFSHPGSHVIFLHIITRGHALYRALYRKLMLEIFRRGSLKDDIVFVSSFTMDSVVPFPYVVFHLVRAFSLFPGIQILKKLAYSMDCRIIGRLHFRSICKRFYPRYSGNR